MEDYKEDGFISVHFVKNYTALKFSRSLIKRLNDFNDNFDPFIIKDLFIEYFDNGLIKNIELRKLYSIDRMLNSKSSVKYYIRVDIYLDTEHSEKFHKLRRDFFRIDCPEILDILDKYYGHSYTHDDFEEMYDSRMISVTRNGNQYMRSSITIKLYSKILYL